MDSCETYETDDVDEAWDGNDLQLAAELGKALLERNRELENQVHQLQTTNHEQNLELQYLHNKIDTMRTMNESRSRVYEELDRNAQELEKNNQKLLMDSKADKQKIERLTGTVDILEARLEEMQVKVDELKQKEAKANQRSEKRRAVSLASLTSDGENKGFYLENLTWTYKEQFKKLPMNPYELEIRRLQEQLQQAKTQQVIMKRKNDDMQVQMSILMEENDKLDERVKTLEDKLDIYSCMEFQLRQAQTAAVPRLCYECGKGISISQESQDLILNEVEHDIPELKSEAKAVKLGGGGSLYGSTESINAVTTTADAREIRDKDTGGTDDCGLSILGELESQYNKLLKKYETMIQGGASSNKRNSGGSEDEETSEERTMRRRLAHKEVQTLINLTINRADFTQDTGQPPPYKALFKDLFATLRKTRIDEDTERTTPSTTPEAGTETRKFLDKAS